MSLEDSSVVLDLSSAASQKLQSGRSPVSCQLTSHTYHHETCEGTRLTNASSDEACHCHFHSIPPALSSPLKAFQV